MYIQDCLPANATPGNLPEPSRKHLEFYFDYLYAERNFSPHTLRAYLGDLYEFLVYLQSVDITVEAADTRCLRAFFTSRTGADFQSRSPDQRSMTGIDNNKNRKLTARSQARKLSSLRSFYRLLHYRDLIKENPARDLPTPRMFKPLPGALRPRDMDRVLETHAPTQKPANSSPGKTPGEKSRCLEIRDRAIYETLYSSGMRIAELLSLRLRDLEQNLEKVKILGKGSRERYVFLGQDARQALQDYLSVRSRLIPKGSKSTLTDHVFLNARGGPLGARGVRFRMEELKQKLGLNRNLSPHKLRHTFATDLLNAGADIRAVQELLGHSRLSTTQIYTGVTKERLRDIHRLCHPHAIDDGE